jgi:hypothetical protein
VPGETLVAVGARVVGHDGELTRMVEPESNPSCAES